MLSAQYRVEDIGALYGDVLLFGGPYSNYQAYIALLACAEAHGIPRAQRICTGDVVGYCADGTLIYEEGRPYHAILGNVEVQLRDGAQDCGCGFDEGTACDLASGVWFAYAAAQFNVWPHVAPFSGTPDMLIFRHGGKQYAVIHGGLTDKSRFIWPDSDAAVFAEEIAEIVHITGRLDGVIAGHSGIPFERVIDGVHWINAGVIGMPPHDGRPETRYAVLSKDGVRFHSLSYDHEAAAQAMEQAGLTQGYEHALRSGLWPSEDVLPPSMRQ